VRSYAVSLTLAVLGLAGCGGLVESPLDDRDSGESSLPFVACGGDLVGTWMPSYASLLRPPPPEDACPGWRRIAITPVVGGSVTFRSDGTYATTTSVGNNETIVVPESCSHTPDCDALQARIAPQGSLVSASCAASGPSECTCREVITPAPAPLVESVYSVDDGGLYIGSATPGGIGSPIPYCVRGNTLSWLSTVLGSEVVLVSATR
jgi:hypothetical protein